MDIIVPLIIVIVVIGGAVIVEKQKKKNKTAKELIADNLADKQKPAEEPIGFGTSLGLFLCANLFLGGIGSFFCETIFTQCTIYICINIICAGCILAHNLTVIVGKK
jgi:hypothetical protein